MTEKLFWELIEASWAAAPEENEDRIDALETNDEDEILELGDSLEDVVIHFYKEQLNKLEKADLIAFLRILEAKLFQLDRHEIHEHTGGDEDDFLASRGLIVGLGEAYFNKISEDPSLATEDAECEEFVFAGYEFYEEKFDEEFEPGEIETGSNPDGGWD